MGGMVGATARWTELLCAAQRAEVLGFDSLVACLLLARCAAEPYVIATLINVNPTKGEGQHVVSKIFGSYTVRSGQTFCKGETVSESVIPAGKGLRIHIALFDEEGGNHEEVREDIEGAIKELAKTGATAIAGAVGSGDINTANTVAGDILNSKYFRAITLSVKLRKKRL